MTLAFGAGVLLLLVAIVAELGFRASDAIGRYGLGFLAESTWDANSETFGVLPNILGTLYSSLLALAMAGVLGISVAICLSQRFLPRRVELAMKNVIELLAAIPSVVYGLWGIYVLIPLLRPVAQVLHDKLGFIPFFSTELSGPGLLPATLVLAVMILPTVTAVSREALAAVPPKLSAAAYGLGATRWEVLTRVVVPTAAGGIFGSIVLAFGRALGETMALAMLAGNAQQIGWSLFSPANTLAALLANHFPEAGQAEASALLYAALVLMAITLLVNVLGALLMMRVSVNLKELRR